MEVSSAESATPQAETTTRPVLDLSLADRVDQLALRDREQPRHILSRVSAYDWLGSVAFVPLGYILAAPLASALGVRTALFFAAIWAASSCAAVLLTQDVRNLRNPSG